MSRIAVVHYVGATQKSRSVVASLVADFRQQGHDVTVLNIGRFGTVFQDFPPEWAVRLAGHKTHRQRFAKVIESVGADLTVLDTDPTLMINLPDSRQAEGLQAIESELLTYFRQETLNDHEHYVRWMRKNLTQQAFACYVALHSWLSENAPNLVVIPNGRTSRQKMARIAAEDIGIAVKFYENGRATKDSYYLGTTQPHDRIASQAEVDSLTSHLSTSEISELAQIWLAERMNPTSRTNSFSAGWGDTPQPTAVGEPRQRAVFFSSSADEFLAFGPMWNIDQWSSQFQAFDMFMERFSDKGVDLILRIHPNLSGKSQKYFRATVAEIKELKKKYPGLIIHWHNSPANSYDLAKSADYVIAERSTIALEANLMGKPVWINQAAQWDLIADVRQVLQPSDIETDDLTPWSVDTSRAERFIAYWVIQEHPLRHSWREWSSWNPEAAPFVMKLISLLGKNPLSHKRHLLSLEWARWRNNHFTV
ncbi:MAG: hypothetical protein RIE23_05765 [Pontimonas sp.]